MSWKPRLIAIDVETTGLHPIVDRLHGLGVACRGPNGGMWSAYYEPAAVHQRVLRWLRDPTIIKVGHRVRFDAKFLAQYGFTLAGTLACTKLLAHLINENESTGLKELMRAQFGESQLTHKNALDKLLEVRKMRHVGELCASDLESPSRFVRDLIGRYCQEDAKNTILLWEALWPRLKRIDAGIKAQLGVDKGPKDYYVEEVLPAERALMDIELGGIRVDMVRLDALRAGFDKELKTAQAAALGSCRAEIADIEAGLVERARSKYKSEKGRLSVKPGDPKRKTAFLLTSSNHVGTLLCDVFGLTVPETERGKRSTNEATLLELQRKALQPRVQNFIGNLLKYREYAKLLGTYLGDADKGLLSHVYEGRVYPEYAPFTDTGRLTSQNPNAQNLPRKGGIKGLLRPDSDDHVFVLLDYSQVELRVAAHLSQDPLMLEAYRLGLDLHKGTATSIFGITEDEVTDDQRQAAKTTNFLLIYDGGPYILQRQLLAAKQEFTIEQCKEFRKGYFERYRVYRAYLDAQKRIIDTRQFVVSETGRMRRLPDAVLGRWLDPMRGRFTGPRELAAPLKEILAAGQAPKLVREQARDPEHALYLLARLKYAHALKQGYNFPVQCLAASAMKRALVALRKHGFIVRNTVHDSFVVQLQRRELGRVKDVVQLCEGSLKLSVPLKVDYKVSTSLDSADALPAAPKMKKIA